MINFNQSIYPKLDKSVKRIIGIDPGVHTGFSVKNLETGTIERVETMDILDAMDAVKTYLNTSEDIWLVFEDARLRTWFAEKGREALQGAGSIKRDCSIWETFCKKYNVRYLAVKPTKGKTKYTSDFFNRLTGWKGRTSEHARDAAMLVWGFNRNNLKLYFKIESVKI